MTANDLRTAMEAAAEAKSEEFGKMLAGLDKDAKTELNALKISQNIANICKMFTGIFLGDSSFYTKRENVVKGIYSAGGFEDFGEYMSVYDLMSQEQRELFLVYAYPIMSVRHNFIDNRKVPQSENITEKEAIAEFKAGIIKGVAEDIISKWVKLWHSFGFSAEKAGQP